MSVGTEYERLKSFTEQIRKVTDFVPETALILGSGLGNFAKNIDVEVTVSYSDIEGFPVSTVPGHAGKFIFGTLSGKKIVAMQGRVHYYEGYEMKDVVSPVRVMFMLGAKKIILTNAAGGINPAIKPGGFMLIKDHISSFVPSPLRGKNADELGIRFPDMSCVYDEEYREKVLETAGKLSIPLIEGVYLQTKGPNFETPAEIQMYKLLGADAVGMSTACESIAARHMGMRVVAISCISNLAAGISKTPLSHEEVQETANRVAHNFEALIKEIVKAI